MCCVAFSIRCGTDMWTLFPFLPVRKLKLTKVVPAHPKLLSWWVESHCYLSTIKSHASASRLALHLGCSHASAPSDSLPFLMKRKQRQQTLGKHQGSPALFPKAMSEPEWPVVLKALELWILTDDSVFPG